jgi:hypothetical protein
MAVDVHGFPMEEYPSVAAKFDLRTNLAFHLTISGSSHNDCDTDVVVTDATVLDQTGAQTAAELQSQIRTAIGGSPDLTVAWSNYSFTIDAIDASAVATTSPTGDYADASLMLFGGELSGTSSATGAFPEDCTIEVDLANDVLTVLQVWWDRYRLAESTREHFVQPRSTGTPHSYFIRGKTMRLYPVPSEQKVLWVQYKGVPALTARGEITGGTEIPSVIPLEFQHALEYYVASKMLQESFDDTLADRRYAQYRRVVGQYAVRYANQHTATSKSTPVRRWFRVET